MLPEDAPVKEQFTLEHFMPTNRAEPLASYFPERVPPPLSGAIETLSVSPESDEVPPEDNGEILPAPLSGAIGTLSVPNLFKLLALFTFIVTIVATIVFIYRRETSRAVSRQFNRTLATSLTAVDSSLARVDAALADLLLATQKTALPDSALATEKAVKSGKIAVIQSWQNLDSLKKLVQDTPGRKVAAKSDLVPSLSPLPVTAAGEINDLIAPTETYLTETQKTFSYYEQFSALQEKAAAILAAVAGYQNNPAADTGLTAISLNNFANDFTAIRRSLSDRNDNLPFALSSVHEENLRSITTWLSLLGNVNAATAERGNWDAQRPAVYEKDQDKTMSSTLQLVTSLNSWAGQSRSLNAEFFRANKTLQKYFYLAPLYQSTIYSLQFSP